MKFITTILHRNVSWHKDSKLLFGLGIIHFYDKVSCVQSLRSQHFCLNLQLSQFDIIVIKTIFIIVKI